MKLEITHQDRYSRGELLLRTFLGGIYIAIPHYFLIFFVSIWSGILLFVTFWVILFTGKYPESIFEFQIKLKKWYLRLNAVLSNLIDGYPAFGLKGTNEKVLLEVEKPERVSRGLLLLRAFFGWAYVGIPHGFCIYFLEIASGVIVFLAWWVVLFTGEYPEKWHAFNVGVMRWSTRVSLYLGYFTDDYPPFSLKA